MAGEAPDAGDIVWIELDPIRGSEQAGRRPALVLTTRSYHAVSPRALICPISQNSGSWPFNVALPEGLRTNGVVLVDQIRAVDHKARIFRRIEKAPDSVLERVRAILAAMLDG